MTSHAPPPAADSPCTAELLATAELPATAGGTGPKLPPLSATAHPPPTDVLASIAELLRRARDTGCPKLPPYVGD